MIQLHYEHLTPDQQSHIHVATEDDPEFEPWEILHGRYEVDSDGHVWLVEVRAQ